MTDHEPYHKLLGDTQHTKKLDDEIDAFAQSSDLFIREAQYTDQEYLVKRGWGHSSVESCVATALAAGVKQLHVGHREPKRDDFDLARVAGLLQQCLAKTPGRGGAAMTTCIPHEGLSVQI